jgi:hypothetical protein
VVTEGSTPFEELLNQSTPYAPANEDEERERLRAAAGRSPAPRPDEGSRTPEDAEPGAPAYVYVPTRPYRPGEDHEVRLELHGIGPDESGLAVFTSEELLTERLGEFQPRARFAALDLLVQVAPAGVRVLVDPAVAPGTDLWTEDTVRSWNEQHPPNTQDEGV